jgi:bacteriocin-like protein
MSLRLSRKRTSMKRNTNTTNIDRREIEAEPAHLDHVLTDEELAHVVGGSPFSITKPVD